MLATASASAAAALVWFALGDLSEPQGYSSWFRPPVVPRFLEGVLATAVLAALVAVATAIRRHRSSALTAMCVASGLLGAFVGFTLRVLSSLTVGANIGGGLLIMASPFVMLPLASVAVACWFRLGRGR